MLALPCSAARPLLPSAPRGDESVRTTRGTESPGTSTPRSESLSRSLAAPSSPSLSAAGTPSHDLAHRSRPLYSASGSLALAAAAGILPPRDQLSADGLCPGYSLPLERGGWSQRLNEQQRRDASKACRPAGCKLAAGHGKGHPLRCFDSSFLKAMTNRTGKRTPWGAGL